MTLSVIFLPFNFLTVRRDVQEDDEEAVRVKEQSILELGTLLAKTGQAAGNISALKAGKDLSSA